MLVAAEIGLRVLARATDRTRAFTLDENLGAHMIPGVTKQGHGWSDQLPAQTNSHGWRDRENTYERTKGTSRILALGDSFTFGWKVDYGQRVTEVLESELANTDVVNMAAPGFAPDLELVAYETEGRRYGADVVLWILFAGNDLDDIRNARASGWPKVYFRLEDGELVQVPPVHTWLERWRVHSYVLEIVLQRLFPQPTKVRAPGWPVDGLGRDSLPLFKAIAARLQRSVADNGSQLLAVIAHRPNSRQPNREGVAMREALDELAIETVDLFETMHGPEAPPQTELFFADDGHWTALGHRLAARAIRDALIRAGWK